jgi:hypothetical protein
MVYIIVFIIIALTLLGYFVLLPALSKFKKCDKCEGQGFWIGTRGDRQNCNICKGSGKVSK